MAASPCRYGGGGSGTCSPLPPGSRRSTSQKAAADQSGSSSGVAARYRWPPGMRHPPGMRSTVTPWWAMTNSVMCIYGRDTAPPVTVSSESPSSSGSASSMPEISCEVSSPGSVHRPAVSGRVMAMPRSMGRRPRSPGTGRPSSRWEPRNTASVRPSAMKSGSRNRRVLPLSPQSTTGACPAVSCSSPRRVVSTSCAAWGGSIVGCPAR